MWELDTCQNAHNKGLEPAGFRTLVVGTTGTGKSTLCNAIVGYPGFDVRSDDTPRTLTSSYRTSRMGPRPVIQMVMDTPDLNHPPMSRDEKLTEVKKWHTFLASANRCAILYTIRGDTPFTEDLYKHYSELRLLWEETISVEKQPWTRTCTKLKRCRSFTELLVLVVSFGDVVAGRAVERMISGGNDPWLRKVVDDADRLYYVFDGKRMQTDDANVDDQLEVLFLRKERANQEKRKSRRTRRSGRVLLAVVIVVPLLISCCLTLLALEVLDVAVGLVLIALLGLLLSVVLALCLKRLGICCG